MDTIMGFVKVTQAEYRRTLVKTAALAPIAVALGRLSLKIMMILGITFLSTGLIFTFPLLTRIGALLVLPITISYLSTWFLLLPYFFLHNRRFFVKLNHLSDLEREVLVAEHPTARVLPTYYDKKRKFRGAQSVYITDSFLYVPGLFLAVKEEIEDIVVSRFNFMDRGEVELKFSFHLKDNTTQILHLKHRYEFFPETIEQMMAWFWGMDPEDSGLPYRTKAWYEQGIKQQLRDLQRGRRGK